MIPSFAIDNAVDSSMHVYVSRQHDDDLLERVGSSSFLTHVQGSRMTGKSSLLFRAQSKLRAQAVTTLFADLTTITAAQPKALLDVTRMIVSTAARRAGMTVPDVVADESVRVPIDVFAGSLAELATASEPMPAAGPRIVLLLDEIDVVADHPWAADFFSMLRDLATRRRDSEALAALRIVAAGVRPLHHLVPDPASTTVAAPDHSIWLDDFVNDAASAAALQRGFPAELRERVPALAWKALEFSGGYPQVCTWLCREMVAHGFAADLGDLEARLVRLAERAQRSPSQPGFFSAAEEYLRSYAKSARTIVDDDPRDTVRRALWVCLDLLRRRTVSFDNDLPAHLLLRWSGLARRDQIGMLQIRSPLLERFYTLDWVHRMRRELEGQPAVCGRRRPAAAPDQRPLVAVLMTGGTIGMVDDGSGHIRPPQHMAEVSSAYADVERFARVEYRNVLGGLRDSAEITPDHWAQIALVVAEQVRNPAIAGVVVAHGTDTLAYTASAVAFALGRNLNKPVVFTGSQATRDVAHGDARANLLRACKVAAEAGDRLPEVVICFGDLVLRACRAQKRDDRRFDAFESPLCPPLAVVAEEVEYADSEIRRHRSPPPPMDVRAAFDSRILTISQVPGLRTALLEPILATAGDENGVRAIIIESLGAGNLPTRKGYSLVALIDRASREDLPVVLTSPYPVLMSNPARYAPARAAKRAGALLVFNVTLPALVAKLAWILGSMPDAVNYADPAESRRIAWVDERIRANWIGESDDVGADGGRAHGATIGDDEHDAPAGDTGSP